MKHLYHRKGGIGFILACILITAIVGSSIWTSTAHAVLPPRPTVKPDNGESTGVGSTPQPISSQIHLYVQPAQPRYWSVVQWQDSNGVWRDVSSWSGDVVDGHVMWWVAEKDFETGPFRWAVYREGGPLVDGEEGTFLDLGEKALLATSQQFHLPNQTRQLVIRVEILDPNPGTPDSPEYRHTMDTDRMSPRNGSHGYRGPAPFNSVQGHDTAYNPRGVAPSRRWAARP